MLHITNNLIKQSFVYTQLNNQTVLFLTIQFKISHLIALSLNIKQFYSTDKWDSVRCYHFRSEWTWKQWQWRGTPHSSKLQYLVSYPRHTLGGFTPLLRSSQCIIQPQLTGWKRGWELVSVTYVKANLVPNEYAHSLKEIIIYCTPIVLDRSAVGKLFLLGKSRNYVQIILDKNTLCHNCVQKKKKKQLLKNKNTKKALTWMFNLCNFLTFKHKITLDELKCR